MAALLQLGSYVDSDDEGPASTTPAVGKVAKQDSDGAASPQPTSFFNADDVELTDSEREQSSDDSDEPEQPQKVARVALPPVNVLLAAAPPKPEFLHRATIYDIKEIKTFDSRKAAEKPKPWLKAGPAPCTARPPPASITAAPPDEDEPTPACLTQPPSAQAVYRAEQVMAAARAMNATYKHVAPTSEDGPRPLIPMCELNNHKKKKSEPGKSFREKEKRKRDLGMQARDKSYVEEEKRILRESMAPTFGQGFD